MKRFYATLALVGALITGANAQRNIDLAAHIVLPSPSVLTDIHCAPTDSLTLSMFFVNNGPDALAVGDTLWLNWPGADVGFINGFILNTAIPFNDTVSINQKLGYLEVKKLNDTGTLDEVAHADFQNSMVYYAVVGIERVGGFVSPVNDDTGTANTFAAAAVRISCTTGINDIKFSKTALSIFPNPASNQISFTNEFKATGTAVVKVTDIAGRTVKTINLGKQNAGTKTFNVDIAELNNGMYYIELTTDDTRSISKFTKN
jgi:hypothetical protein